VSSVEDLDDWRDFCPPFEDEARAGGGRAPSVAERKMTIEWFDDAAGDALSESNNPLIDGLLDEGALSVIYGDSNSGKTFVALDMAFAVSTGAAWNDKKTKRGLVVYIAAEGGKRIKRRLAALKKREADRYGESDERPLFALIRFPIDLRSSDANLNELLARIREAEKETGEACVWIVVDTLSRAMAGGDENSPVDMGRIVSAADRVRGETGAHFSYVHHTGKDAARGARGHSLLRAATDTEIEVVPNAISVTKQRDMEGGFNLGFALVDIEIGIDLDGNPVKSAVVEWTENGGAAIPKAETGKSIPRAQLLLMDVVNGAIAEAGTSLRPFGENGPTVRAVAEGSIRTRYYARMADQAEDGESPKTVIERQKKAFRRSLESALKSKLLFAMERDGKRIIWLS
jgi:KaiC/GvpD/RAD55 family RecA-like ATPase